MNITHLKNIVRSTPVVGSILRAKYNYQFEENKHGQLYRGIFDTYKECAASAPRGLKAYHNEESGNLYTELRNSIESYDYPVLFHLQQLLGGSLSTDDNVFDYGGHVGIKYYAYSKYLALPNWTVCDTPWVVSAGASMAARRNDQRLSFTSKFERCRGHKLLLALGSLQYIDEGLGKSIVTELSPRDRPQYVMINTTAFTATNEERGYYTLNSMGNGFAPYKVQNQADFLGSMHGAGYALKAQWENPGRSCNIPFQTEHPDFRYLGMLFEQLNPL